MPKYMMVSASAHSCSLTLVVVRHEREGKVEGANEYQNDCDKFYNSFVLHFDNYVIIFYDFAF